MGVQLSLHIQFSVDIKKRRTTSRHKNKKNNKLKKHIEDCLNTLIKKKYKKKSNLITETYENGGIRFTKEGATERCQEIEGELFENIDAFLDSEAWDEYNDEDDDISEYYCWNSNDLHYACVDVIGNSFITKLNDYEELKIRTENWYSSTPCKELELDSESFSEESSDNSFVI